MYLLTNNSLSPRIHLLFHPILGKASSKFWGILVLALLFTSSAAFACTCNPYSIRVHYQASGLVFSGKVIAEKTINVTDPNQTGISIHQKQVKQYTFEVQKVFKGRRISSQVNIYTGMGHGDCGFPFEIGERYFVFAYQQSNWVRKGPTVPAHWYTDSCMGTTGDWNGVAKMVLNHQF